jgi:hypothetical protein
MVLRNFIGKCHHSLCEIVFFEKLLGIILLFEEVDFAKQKTEEDNQENVIPSLPIVPRVLP